MAELVNARVDVIVVIGELAIRAAQHATTTILSLAPPKIWLGHVGRSLGPAGRQQDRYHTPFAATEVDGKRQEILIEAMPQDFVGSRPWPTPTRPRRRSFKDCRTPSAGAALSLRFIGSPEPRRFPAAIEAAKASGAEALNVLASPVFYANRQIVIQRVAAFRLPAMDPRLGTAEEGGFVAYGPRVDQAFRPRLPTYCCPAANDVPGHNRS